MIKSICVVRLSALGDALMFVPLVRTLQANFPEATITWIISRPAYDLLEGLDGVEFIVIKKPQNIKDYWQFKRQMKGRVFDVLLAAQASFRANLLYPLITARRKIGYDALRAKDGHAWFVNESIAPGCDHTLEGFLKFAEPLGIKKKVIRWDLFIDEDARAWARDTLSETTRPRVIINPAASKPERNWPLARYIEVIRQLQQRWQAQVILTGGPGIIDREMGAAIEKEVSVMNVIGKTVPKQLLALIEQADVVLCPDTGPSHMGAAVGTPVIALHAVTSAEVSGPYTYRHLAVDCYEEAVKTILKKDKVSNRWGTHAHGAETMKLVTVDAVMAQFEVVLGGI